jgi:hypothetical protein
LKKIDKQIINKMNSSNFSSAAKETSKEKVKVARKVIKE